MSFSLIYKFLIPTIPFVVSGSKIYTPQYNRNQTRKHLIFREKARRYFYYFKVSVVNQTFDYLNEQFQEIKFKFSLKDETSGENSDSRGYGYSRYF